MLKKITKNLMKIYQIIKKIKSLLKINKFYFNRLTNCFLHRKYFKIKKIYLNLNYAKVQ